MLAGYSLAAVCELLVAAASLVVECWALGHMRFSIVARGHSCPRQVEFSLIKDPTHVPPAVTGGFLSTGPPGKS